MSKRISDRARVVTYFTTAESSEAETMLDVVKAVVQSRTGPKPRVRKDAKTQPIKLRESREQV